VTLAGLTLPAWFDSYRDHQVTAIAEVLDAFQYSDVVVLDAPTGSGKTLIAESVRQALDLPAIYTCHSKSLQDQFFGDYPYAHILKGRSNYATELYPERYGSSWNSLSCEDCTKSYRDGDCDWCSDPSICPYEVAKSEAVDSDLMVVNTSYLLTEANYVGKLSRRGSSRGQLIIADECDLLDEAVTSFVQVSISARTLKELKIGPPRRMTVEDSWLEWLEGIEPVVVAKAKEARVKARSDPNKRTVSRANYLSGLQRKLGDLRKGLESRSWVYTGDRDRVEFKPVWASEVAKGALWRHGSKWLLMSATVISAGSLLSELGHGGNSGLVVCPSTFPAENRPIFIRPVANMRAKEKEVEWPKLIPEIQRILDRHRGDRVLVHTHSYELANYLHQVCSASNNSRPILTYTSASDRQSVLAQYLAEPASVLFAPSLDRGIDLPDDACRVQIIAKCPFGYLGDRQINARLHSRNGQEWYTVNAIRDLVQMCGRGVRSETDTCSTYILDSQFVSKLWGMNRLLFPKWWRDALVWRSN
jgi:ATP-dependent DNA helicase DinG